jgi:gliding motility-associated-like protein
LLADGQDANCGTSDGLAWVVVTGGSVPYTYQWDSGQVNSIGDTISLLDAGVYGVTVSDSLGCLDSANVLVGDDPAPTIDSIEIKNVSCYGLSDGEVFIQITSIGGDSFFLTSPPNLIIKQDSNHFVGLGVGSYIIGIKDSSECLSLDSFNITQPPLLLPPDTIMVDDTICENIQFMSQSGLVSGADSYGWTFSGITVSIDSFNSDSSEIYFTPLSSGSLSICIYANDSCGSSATYCRNIIVLGAPDAPLGITGDLMVCENTSYNYSISPVAGASSYHWSFPSGTSIISGQGTTNISVLYTSGTTGGNICVQAVNYCDTSLAYCDGVIVYTFPIVPGAINGSLNVCAGDTELYYINPVSGTSSYVWSYPAGCVVVGPSDQDSINIVWGSVAGQICVASSNACGVSVSSCINVLNPSIGSIGNIQSTATLPDSLCVGDIVNYFISPVSGADVYVWDVPSNNGLSLLSTNNNTITVEVTAAFVNNTITVYAYNTCDTTVISSFSIYAGVTPIADFSFIPDVCSGDAVSFTDISINALSWSWEFGDGLSSSSDQNPVFVYGSGGLYNVSLAVGNGGCRDTIIKQVTIYQTPVISILYDDTCALDTILFNGLTNDPGSIISYVWDFGDNPDMGDSAYTQSPSYLYDSSGQYTVVLSVVDSNGCDAISLRYMNIYGIDIEAFQYQEIFRGQSADIYGVSNNAISYQWTPSLTLSDPAASNTIATPELTTTYTLEVSSPEGCSNQDTVTIYVDQRRQLFIPLAFTPNSDGINDLYRVNGNGICEIELFIYNRYGELVFYSTDINDGWDGTHKGEMQTSEEYAVMVKGVFCDGVEFGPGVSLPTNPSSNPYPGDVKVECVGSFTLFR